jgi:hypothetical protein
VSAVIRAPRRPAQHAVDGIAVDVRRAMTAARGESFGDHAHDRQVLVAGQRRIRLRPRENVEQRTLAPLGRRHLGDDLLREHVERLRRDREAIELAAAHRIEERRALDELVARQREEPRLRLPADGVVGTPGALQERRDRARRSELTHELDVADVDAELERRRGDERAERTAFNRCSASKRRSFARLPWWAVTTSEPMSSDRWRATRSAILRVLTKTSVVRCSWVSAARRAYTCCQTSPDMIASSGAGGTSSARSRSRTCPTSTIVQSAADEDVPVR